MQFFKIPLFMYLNCLLDLVKIILFGGGGGGGGIYKSISEHIGDVLPIEIFSSVGTFAALCMSYAVGRVYRNLLFATILFNDILTTMIVVLYLLI